MAVALLVLTWSPSVSRRDWVVLASLAVLAIAETELSNRIGRVRRYFVDVVYIDLISVWSFAGALVLPPQLIAILVAVVYGHIWGRIWRATGVRKFHRVVFGATAAFVGWIAANKVSRLIVAGVPGSAPLTREDFSAIVLGGAIAFVIDLLLVMAALRLRQPHRPIRELVGGWRENSVEVATMCLGVFTALVAANLLVFLIVMLVPVLVLHRGVLMQQLEDRASTEPKTGLLNSAAWHEHVEREMARAVRQSSSFGVLMVDLDHFKEVNDTYGHVAGDEVLKAVATVLRTETRAYDSVGRFGGEEFVVLMPESPKENVMAAAERIRSRVAELRVSTRCDEDGDGDGAAPPQPVVTGLSASVGVAIYPHDGTDAQRVLRSADAAVYLAKRRGRNQVVMLETPESEVR
jgi:diguanylate cyclase (GGDEF)-like protein